MTHDQRLAISELRLSQLIDFSFSAFKYGNMCHFDLKDRKDCRSLGTVKNEVSKNLLFISCVLKDMYQRKKYLYYQALAQNRKSSRDIRQSLRFLKSKHDVITKLFWFSVAEEIPEVLFLKSVQMLEGWEVVTEEKECALPKDTHSGIHQNFFSLFVGAISCDYLVPNTELSFELISEGEEVLGNLSAVAFRIFSLFTLVSNEMSEIIDKINPDFNIEGDTSEVFSRIEKITEDLPEIYPYSSVIQGISEFIDQVFWTIVNEDYPHLKSSDLGVREGLKVVRVLNQKDIEITEHLLCEDAYELAQVSLDMALSVWEYGQEPEGSEIHPTFVSRIKKISQN